MADVTRLLLAWSNGDQEAVEQLAPLIYDELRRKARRLFSRERRKDHTLRPTALVNEAFAKLIDQERLKLDPNIKPREHFMWLAGRLMRHILVDHAVARAAEKRPEGHTKVTLDESLFKAGNVDLDQIVFVNQLLERLEKLDPLLAEILDQRIVLGYTAEETAVNLGMSVATVNRRAAEAYAWLRREIESGRRSGNESGTTAPDTGNL
jgi:RNA polymerase sigma factor (TIGR02999 family)